LSAVPVLQPSLSATSNAKGRLMFLTQERLKEILSYDPATGEFYAKLGPRTRTGNPCGHVDKNGYRRIRVDGRRYLAHRLAWFYVHGTWPAEHIDHINGEGDDNRIANLRPASRAQNRANNRGWGKSGLKGAHYNRFRNYWQAYIKINGRSHWLGRFDSREDAHAAYVRAALLKTLHAKGLSFSKIASRIGCGLSRNAVIGKAARLGLPRRGPDRKGRASQRNGTPSPLQLVRTTAPRPSRTKAAGSNGTSLPVESAAAVPEKPENCVSLAALKVGMCRYPYGDSAPFEFCGRPTCDGASYCEGHHRLCLTPVPKVRAA
jgi:hypothetical protein